MRLRSSGRTIPYESSDHEVELETKPRFRRTSKKKSDIKNGEMTSEQEPALTKPEVVKDDDRHVTLFGHRMNTVLLVTHLNIALYSLCFWITNGVLPYLTKKLGVETVVFGYLQTTFAIVQLCGGPVFGRFGDLFGGRLALSLAFMSAAVSYFILGLSYSVPLLFVSRLPSLFLHAMQGGQMVVTDLSDEKERASALAKLSLSYGSGMVVGPLLGGLLVRLVGLQNTSFCAGFISLFSVFLVMRFIPRYTKPKEHVNLEASSSQMLNLQKYVSLTKVPGVLFLLFFRLVSGIPIGIFQSMFVVVAMETFKLPPEQNGMMMSYVAVISMCVQAFGIPILTKRFTENSLLKWASFILMWAYLALSQTQSLWQLIACMFPMVIGLTMITVVVSSSLTKLVPMSDTGIILGLNMALNSSIRVVSPTIGGAMLSFWGFPSIGYLGFLNSAFISAVFFVKYRGNK